MLEVISEHEMAATSTGSIKCHWSTVVLYSNVASLDRDYFQNQ